MIRVFAILLFFMLTPYVRAAEEAAPMDPEFQALSEMTADAAPPAAEAPKTAAETKPPEPTPEPAVQEQTAENKPPPQDAPVENPADLPVFSETPTAPAPPPPTVQMNPDGYRVQQKGNNLELITPYGRKILFGEPGVRTARDYKLEVPLDDLRPPEAKKEKEREPASFPGIQPIPWPMPAKSEEKPEPKKEAPPRVIVEYDYTDRLILEANRLYNRRKFYEASVTVEEILTKRPDFARGWAMKGSLMFVQGQKDLAKTAWQKALELDPANAQVQQYLGRLK